MADEGESARALSAGIEQVAEFLLAYNWAALLWDAGFAAAHFTPSRACGVSHCKRVCTALLPEAVL